MDPSLPCSHLSGLQACRALPFLPKTSAWGRQHSSTCWETVWLQRTGAITGSLRGKNLSPASARRPWSVGWHATAPIAHLGEGGGETMPFLFVWCPVSHCCGEMISEKQNGADPTAPCGTLGRKQIGHQGCHQASGVLFVILSYLVTHSHG